MSVLVKEGHTRSVRFECDNCYSEFTEELWRCTRGVRKTPRFICNEQDEWDCFNGLESWTEDVPTLTAICPKCGHSRTIDERWFYQQLKEEEAARKAEEEAKRKAEHEKYLEQERIRAAHRDEYDVLEKRVGTLYRREFILRTCKYKMMPILDNLYERIKMIHGSCREDEVHKYPEYEKAVYNFMQVQDMADDFRDMLKQAQTDFQAFKELYHFA